MPRVDGDVMVTDFGRDFDSISFDKELLQGIYAGVSENRGFVSVAIDRREIVLETISEAWSEIFLG